MDLPGVGTLTLERDLGWYYSEPMPSATLDGTVGRLVVDEEHLTDAGDVAAAAVAFLSGDGSALRAASDHVFAYYLDTVREVREQGWDATLPEIAGPAEVWEHVTFGREWHLDRRDGQVYVSVECECTWEPEHGLQLVFRDGRTITKVGPYDGHLTNAAAYARTGLEDVVYVSSDAL